MTHKQHIKIVQELPSSSAVYFCQVSLTFVHCHLNLNSVYSHDCSGLSLICSSPPERQNHCHLTMAGEEKITQGKQTCLPWEHKYYLFELLGERKNYQELT